ncbi:MAG: translesion DNA synthesis-associated protein ImuA [Proteobacteria bacterium]|nr:translesion DNA synthesis-associated protein ImuA [Pseudomonadota bacterium]MCH9005801.1 translesion DNA synthesis-associated protein ImuA [Pseudomonadota bacterium]
MSLEKLLENPRVWRGSSQIDARARLVSGYPELDRCLPGGGWPLEALTEILIGQYGMGELRLLMPALAQLSAEEIQTHTGEYTEPGWIAWVAPPFQPYAPALQQYGIDLSRMLIVRPKDDSELLWSAEQALSSGTCAAVLLWPDTLDDKGSRRLQLAAEKGHSWAIAFRPLAARQQPSAAALRLELESTGQGTRVHILKSRGGRPTVLDSLL